MRDTNPIHPRPGVAVRTVAAVGTWRVWSAGPEPSSWWLQPDDDEALSVVAHSPPELHILSGCLSQPTKNLTRPSDRPLVQPKGPTPP